MPTVNQGDLVRIPVQSEPVIEVDASGRAPRLTGTIKRTWFQFLQNLYTRGFWNMVAFGAGNFTASGAMTWTVDSADQVTWQFTQVGKTLFCAFVLRNTSIGGVPGTTLHILIPRTHLVAETMTTAIWLKDSGVITTGKARVVAGSATIDITRTDEANFTAAVNTTDVEGQIVFEVEG